MRNSWLYTTVCTALAAVPVLGLPRVQNDESTTFVTLNIPSNGRQVPPLTLRLDLGQSRAACGYANLTINGHQLAQDGNGNGHGVIAAHDGNFTADWAFSCHKSLDMLLKLQLVQLDGLEIAPVNLSASFKQTIPQQLRVVDGAAVVNRIHKLPHEDTGARLPDQMQSQIHDLDMLRIQARQLEGAILAQENRIAQLLGRKKPSPSVNIQDCQTLDCVLSAFGGKFREAAEKLGGDLDELKDFIAHSEDGSLPVPNDYEYWYGQDDEDDDSPEEYDLRDHRGKWQWMDQVPLTEGEVESQPTGYVVARHQPPLVMAIAISVIGLCILSTWFVLLLHRRTTTLPLAVENEKVLLSERPPCWKDSPSERRARRKARRQAAGEYVRSIFTRWCHTTQAPAPAPAPASAAAACEESSSIEEEFASFREAVSVVDSIVAAEEGRNRQVPTYTPFVAETEGCAFRDDESLPPYESEDESSPVVDGFRFGARRVDAPEHDRLGYGK